MLLYLAANSHPEISYAVHQCAHFTHHPKVSCGCWDTRSDGCTDQLDGVKGSPQWYLTEFRQPLQVQSHLEMPGILVQLGHIQRT